MCKSKNWTVHDGNAFARGVIDRAPQTAAEKTLIDRAERIDIYAPLHTSVHDATAPSILVEMWRKGQAARPDPPKGPPAASPASIVTSPSRLLRWILGPSLRTASGRGRRAPAGGSVRSGRAFFSSASGKSARRVDGTQAAPARSDDVRAVAQLGDITLNPCLDEFAAREVDGLTERSHMSTISSFATDLDGMPTVSSVAAPIAPYKKTRRGRCRGRVGRRNAAGSPVVH